MIFANPVVSVMMHLDLLRSCRRGVIAPASSQKPLYISDKGEFNGRRSVMLACSLGST